MQNADQMTPRADTHHLRRKRQGGQITLFAVGMVFTLIAFFSFSLQVGLLVNAKINLQNAADLAAYAGAATQARQLNSIGFLNYELRQQYKKFLFRYYVLGTLSGKYPGRDIGSGDLKAREYPIDLYSSGNALGSTRLLVPAVCVDPVFLGFSTGNESTCRQGNLPSVVGSFQPVPMEPVSKALFDTLKQIEQFRRAGCEGNGKLNVMLPYYWLYNVDPDYRELEGLLMTTNGDAAQRLKAIRLLASGIGLIPRSILLSTRIKNLAHLINAPSVKGVTLEAVNGWRNGASWARYERTVQAYLSAYNTLGPDLFPTETITFDELMPSGAGTGGTKSPWGSSANMIKLKQHQTGLTTFAIDQVIGDSTACKETSAAASTGDETQGCSMCITPLEVAPPSGPILGFSKDPTVMTYYAVRLKATARVMFAGNVEMTAVSAARPFGSRIGPPPQALEGAFTSEGASSTIGLGGNIVPNRCISSGASGGCEMRYIPNLALEAGADLKDIGTQFSSALAAATYGSSIATGAITSQKLRLAQALAMAPTDAELKTYLIPNDLEPKIPEAAQNTIEFFEGSKEKEFYPIYAPLSLKSATNATEVATEIIADYIEKAGDIKTLSKPMQDYLKAQTEALKQGFQKYAARLEGNGVAPAEDREGMNIYRMRNPYLAYELDPNLKTQLTSKAPWIKTKPRDARTSWAGVEDASISDNGRVGYSVKFVTFKSLISGTSKGDNNGAMMTNRLNPGDLGFEPERLSH